MGAGCLDAPFAVFLIQGAALKFGATAAFADGHATGHTQARQLCLRGGHAHHSEQRRAHELVEGCHHRHRVARQTEQPSSVLVLANFAKSHWPPRFHGNFPESHFTQTRHQLTNEICIAHRHTAAGHNCIRMLRCFQQGGFQRGWIIAHHAHVDDFAAQPGQHAPHRVAVAVVDFARLQHVTQ